ncbi:unnamed protein product [Gongylonema pulchrum]|uniref:BPI2 domain-containing protein n=1 Tax=Gongylonema pulchrum TaxID=637853 RepID=A0A183EHU7_9BILA|nr:unnamed protein product [Gongylonema pulchrum]
MIRNYATPYEFDIELNGEFSPGGRGGTPFGAFPMQWPTPIGTSMVEIMISDFTINSLLYWMHKRDFLSFRIGPQTPGIGQLLTTTCDSGGDYSGAAAGGLSSLGDLADLGVCLGDIMPAVKEKYPNRTLAIVVHTAQAPSIMLSGRGGGGVQIDLVAFADIYIEGTNIRVGTITITVMADVALQVFGNRIVGNATLPVLRLADRDSTLGLGQDAMDNLANLAKDMVVKAANQQLNKGMTLSLPTSNLPVNIINPQIRILNHAIFIGSDFTIAPSALQMLS